ncbi:kinase-like protein [Rostrohypoxylon terebratum]|nr:kinase-like protein [Rostrohypoxylon terebratum]
MKPENILWFKGPVGNGQFENDVLKISDFGLTRWHGSISNDQTDIQKLAVSRSYRAPEYDLYRPVSQAWDIWSLACLYLEFITWYLCGWEEGVDEFSKDRTRENSALVREGNYAISEDHFFNLATKNGSETNLKAKYEASLKLSVISWINKLHATEGCSEFIHDFLDLISDNMLRIGSDKRIQCEDVASILDTWYNRCQDENYFSFRNFSLSYHSLDNLLRDKLNQHRDGKHNDFLTLYCLQHLLTPERVREHLQVFLHDAKKGGYSPRVSNAEYYLKLICSDDQTMKNSTQARQDTYIRLFATLILANKGADIFKFIDRGVSDRTLPTTIVNKDLQWCMEAWTERRHLDDFDMWQWKMNVPFLEYGQHKTFNAQIVLPFIAGSNTEISGLYSDSHSRVKTHVPSITEAGGYGEVKCVEIHSKCHNFHKGFASLSREEGPFALKKLLEHDPARIEEDFKREVEMLKKFDGAVHPHIVTVLTTFKHGDCYYLLFPWAECDLGRYFEYNPKPTHSLKTVRWLCNQCLRIMEAVHLIHFPPGVNNLQPGDRLFGRHGDIKAENILVFRSQEGEANLVLSDFGLGSVHHDISKSNVPKEKVAVTPDFRPPECDMEGGQISRAYDVWTLGCLFLDLLTWYLGGEQLRQDFDKQRMSSYMGGPETPIYFEVVLTENKKHGYIVKSQVKTWLEKLHEHTHCSNFVHEFLDLIEQEMLIVETNEKKRARTNVLLQKLQSFNRKCQGQKSETYCLDGSPYMRDPKIKSELPIAEGPLNQSAKGKLRIELRTVRGHTQRVVPAQD